MKKFSYSLQPILNLNEQKLKIEKEKLADVLARYEEQKLILREIYKELDKTLKQNDDNTKEGTKISNVVQNDLYKKMLYEKIIKQRSIIKVIEEDIERIRERLLDINKNKESLENLKEKKIDEYRYSASLEQAVVVDELLSYKVAKNIIGG